MTETIYLADLVAPPNPAWLIECGSPAQYLCNDKSWCNNSDHAHRFATKLDAELIARNMTTMEPVRVAEHVWSDD